ncbi:MAG: rod shape-determining protein RodA [Gammaproteobacteria bacterium CG_4_10_14_0_8_um_filter_38_16]|nr:MAG: rod shape-determining protein RodA [Gammaproteobacteria bacterium CG_4_10_14_0_8_um_filter_38_16]PJA04009.1 MAG: rod shape-determining protein RodA [Gammaproteobacteria bacterium CG_4_10_14_0_2_um_filter_38_22]PJB11021.1 MAG: rod shape-determining protein RodA [Gammaproteobacteria bacterium CG_4_9_14_3_um_filter_38_9]
MNSQETYEKRLTKKVKSLRWQKLHLDPFLLLGLIALATIGLFILYSASNASSVVVEKQAYRLALSFALMCLFAQIPYQYYKQWAPWLYGISFALLLAVLVVGKVDMGARRWLSLGFFRFQPSEIMTLAMPIMLAWYLSEKELPPTYSVMLIAGVMILMPALFIAKEPDLGTAIVVTLAGFFVLLLAGMRWRIIGALGALLVLLSPVIWHFMHTYQKDRVLTFLNPERDPLGSGYHIIQSKIAIGSGGIFGKGWMHGTQSHLSFLPAHTTDFIFAVSGEELGLIGCFAIIFIFLLIFARCLYISLQAQDNFTRLLSGTIGLTFIASAFINLGMVTGILPVVGVPLPLVSYGGSSMISLMINFGIIMSIHTHRRLWSS